MDLDQIMADLGNARVMRQSYDPESQMDFDWPEPDHVVGIPDNMKPKPRVLAREGNIITVNFGARL